MLNVLNALRDTGRAGKVPDAYRDYLPEPAHRKRAAVIAPSAGALTGGCYGLIYDMVNRGHRVFAFAPELSNKDLRLLSHIGAEAYSLPPRLALRDKYRQMRELSTILADADPDTALIQTSRSGVTSVAAAKIARVPQIVTVVPGLGPAFMEAAPTSAWGERQALKVVYRTVFSWSDAVIFHSVHDRKYAQDHNLLSKSKMHFAVGGWGEDLTRNVQRALPPLDRGVLFVMAAPLDRYQGVIEYCEAAQAVRLKSRRARFFLASTPGETPSPLPAEELRPYRDCVQYIGPVEDAGPVISRCHVLVAPSYGHGAPRPLSQALAAGRPIITTETRSCRDFVIQGASGYRVAVRDPVSLARAMAQMLQRPDLIASMAQESRRLALRLYDVNSVNTLLLEALGL